MWLSHTLIPHWAWGWLAVSEPHITEAWAGLPSHTLIHHSANLQFRAYLLEPIPRKGFVVYIFVYCGKKQACCALRRLQAQTLPNVTQPIGKINPLSKMTVNSEPLMQFWCPSGLESFLSLWHILFYNSNSYLKSFGHGGAVKLWEEKDDSLN